MRPVMMIPKHTPGFGRTAALLLLLMLTAAGLWALLLTSPAPAQAQTPAPLGNPADLTATPGPGIGEITLAWTPAANADAGRHSDHQRQLRTHLRHPPCRPIRRAARWG